MKLDKALVLAIANELRMNRLYNKLAAAHRDKPRLATFWADMERAEKEHAEVLSRILHELDDAQRDQEVDFDRDLLTDIAADIDGLLLEMQSGSPPIGKIFASVVDIETSEQNRAFVKLIEICCDEISLNIYERMAYPIDRHIAALMSAIKRFSNDERLLHKLAKLTDLL